MMQQMGEVAPMAPQLMGCCSIDALFWGMTAMATPLVAIAAVVYLLTCRPDVGRIQEDC